MYFSGHGELNSSELRRVARADKISPDTTEDGGKLVNVRRSRREFARRTLDFVQRAELLSPVEARSVGEPRREGRLLSLAQETAGKAHEELVSVVKGGEDGDETGGVWPRSDWERIEVSISFQFQIKARLNADTLRDREWISRRGKLR